MSTPWRTYADPPQSDGALDAAQRRSRGRERRHDVDFDDALDDNASGYVVWMCADALGAVQGPRAPIIDALAVDDALPGPWEADLLDLARRRGLTGGAAEVMAQAYQAAVAAIAAEPLHAVRAAALRRASRLAKDIEPAAVASSEAAVRRLVSGKSAPAQLRSDRVSLRWGAEAGPAQDLGAELAQYRESLPEPTARLLAQYRVADALADSAGRVLILMARGQGTDDVILLEAAPAEASSREDDYGAWRDGSDVQRVLLARESVPLIPSEFAGWSTSADGATARVWSRARAAKSLPDWGPKRARARALGSALGLLHATTGDAASLAGYLGHSSRFPEAVRAAMKSS